MFLPTYQILSEDQIQTIHDHTIDLLENTGVVVQHEKALESLAEFGERMDFDKQRACFQPEFVIGVTH